LARARTCQNGIVGVSCWIDIPGIVFIRVTGRTELCVTMRVRRREPVLCPLLAFHSSYSRCLLPNTTRFYFLSLSLSSPRGVSSHSVIKSGPDVWKHLLHRVCVPTYIFFVLASLRNFRFISAMQKISVLILVEFIRQYGKLILINTAKREEINFVLRLPENITS